MATSSSSVPGADPAECLLTWPAPPTYPDFAPVRGLVVQDYTKGGPVAVDLLTDFDFHQGTAAGSCLRIPPQTVEITVDEAAWTPEFEGPKVLVGFSTSAAREVIRIPVGTHVIAFVHMVDTLVVRAADNPGVDLTKVIIRLALTTDRLPAVAYKFAMRIVGMDPGMAVCQGMCCPLFEGTEHFRPRAPLAELVPGLVVLELSVEDQPRAKPTGAQKIQAALNDPALAPKLLPVPGATLANEVMTYGDWVMRTTRVVRATDYEAVAATLKAGHPDVHFVAAPLKRPVYATEDQVRAEYEAWRVDLLAQARELETLTRGRFVWHESTY